MWELLMGILAGDAVSKSRFGRFVRPILALAFVALLAAGLIYAAIVLHAVSERSNSRHVGTHSSH